MEDVLRRQGADAKKPLETAALFLIIWAPVAPQWWITSA
jgi:hypothetical protein